MVKTYALFGPTNPQETGPYGHDHCVFAGRCPERSCFKTTCASGLCMKSILPQTVFKSIAGDACDPKNTCDIYKTELAQDEDYGLIPQNAESLPFFDKAGSALTRVFFDDQTQVRLEPGETLAIHRDESLLFVKVCENMRNLLKEYLKTKEKGTIGEYEAVRQNLLAFKGIGAFWSAILTIRLNSVPLLDIKKAVQTYCSEIESTMNAVGRVTG
jgi:hypothetical protein